MKRIHMTPLGIDLRTHAERGAFDLSFSVQGKEVVLHLERQWVSIIARALHEVIAAEKRAIAREEQALRGEG